MPHTIFSYLLGITKTVREKTRLIAISFYFEIYPMLILPLAPIPTYLGEFCYENLSLSNSHQGAPHFMCESARLSRTYTLPPLLFHSYEVHFGGIFPLSTSKSSSPLLSEFTGFHHRRPLLVTGAATALAYVTISDEVSPTPHHDHSVSSKRISFSPRDWRSLHFLFPPDLWE